MKVGKKVKLDKKQRDHASAMLLIGATLYIASCIWINFHGKQWYSFDIYSDALLSRIMVEQGSIFPDNWVFGNQFYIVATPVLAAGIYAMCHSSVLAMSIASSIMIIVIIGCYFWLVSPFVDKKCRIVGLFCLSGAIILGNSASSYGNGLQYLYTMASFYACYIFTILLTLGIYFRIRVNKHCSVGVMIISGILSFALGMQSLRELLVLYLPLCAFSVLMSLCKKENKKSMVYVFLLTAIDAAGVLAMKCIPVKSAPIISDISLTLNVNALINNFKITTSEFLTITGLNLFRKGLKWIPLSAVYWQSLALESFCSALELYIFLFGIC